jgi:hypothetical protein
MGNSGQMRDESTGGGTPRASHRDAARLLGLVFVVFGAQLILFLAARLFHWGHSSWIWAQPTDLAFFRDGARVWLSGGNPYEINGFVTPPPSLLFSAPLAALGRPLADHIFISVNLVLLTWSLRRYAAAVGLARREQALFLLTAAIFFSTQESIRQCNLDVLMLALLVLTFTTRGKSSGALALGASIGAKAYSVLFLPVMLRFRQWRPVGIAVLTFCLLLLPFYRLWTSAYHALLFRSGRFWNVSIAPASLVYPLLGGDAKVESLATLLLYEFLAITFIVALIRDRNPETSPQTLGRYAPWMLAMPSLVFSYVGVQALPVLAVLLGTSQRRPLRRSEWCILAGFLLLGIHAERIACALPLAYDSFRYWRAHVTMIQAAGVVLMIAGTCLTPVGATPSLMSPAKDGVSAGNE